MHWQPVHSFPSMPFSSSSSEICIRMATVSAATATNRYWHVNLRKEAQRLLLTHTSTVFPLKGIQCGTGKMKTIHQRWQRFFCFVFFERDGNNIMKETNCFRIHILSYNIYIFVCQAAISDLQLNGQKSKMRLLITMQAAIVSKLQSTLLEA